MLKKVKKLFKKNNYKNRSKSMDPDEIFIDSENLPNFDVDQFEDIDDEVLELLPMLTAGNTRH